MSNAEKNSDRSEKTTEFRRCSMRFKYFCVKLDYLNMTCDFSCHIIVCFIFILSLYIAFHVGLTECSASLVKLQYLHSFMRISIAHQIACHHNFSYTIFVTCVPWKISCIVDMFITHRIWIIIHIQIIPYEHTVSNLSCKWKRAGPLAAISYTKK